MVWMDHILFTHLPVDGQWGCFHLWTVVNIYEHKCANISLKPCFHFFGCLCRSGIAGSYGDSMFNFWSNRQALLHRVCTIVPPASPMCSNFSCQHYFLLFDSSHRKRCKGSVLGLLSHVILELCLTSETLRQQLPLTGHAAL